MLRLFFLLISSFVVLYAKLNIAVSIPPQEFLVKKITGNLANITTIVKPGNSPHTYEPKPSQMIELSKANLYLAIGVEFENAWLERFKSQNRNLKIYYTDKNIQKITIKKGKEKGEPNPHIWLSPKNLKIIAKNIANALIVNDKNNSKIYKNNLEKVLKELDNLDKNISAKLSKLKNRNFLTFHPAWSYFAKDYNLTQLTIEINGKEPSIKELIKIINFAKEKNVKVIIAEPEFSDKSAKVIAKELNIKVVKISPLQKDIYKTLIKFTNTLLEK